MSDDTKLKILRIQQVVQRTGLSRSTVYDKLNEKSTRSDSSFPRPICLGGKAIGWFESEIDAWLASRPRSRRNLEAA